MHPLTDITTFFSRCPSAPLIKTRVVISFIVASPLPVPIPSRGGPMTRRGRIRRRRHHRALPLFGAASSLLLVVVSGGGTATDDVIYHDGTDRDHLPMEWEDGPSSWTEFGHDNDPSVCGLRLLTVDEWEAGRYWNGRVPVMVSGVTNGWRALDNWKKRVYPYYIILIRPFERNYKCVF